MADQDSEQERIVLDNSALIQSVMLRCSQEFLPRRVQLLSMSRRELQELQYALLAQSPEDLRRFYAGAMKTSQDTLLLANMHRRLEYLETVYEHGVRPTLAAMAKHMWSEKDVLPPASSVEYELFDRLAEIENIARVIIDHYADLDERLNDYVLLVSKLKDFIDKTHTIENRFFFRAVLMIYDALCCMYAEDLTQERLTTVYTCVVKLQEPEWDKDKLRSLDKQLRASGFETVPSDRFRVQEKKREHADIP